MSDLSHTLHVCLPDTMMGETQSSVDSPSHLKSHNEGGVQTLKSFRPS